MLGPVSGDFLGDLSDVRLAAYSDFLGPSASRDAIESLYIWQIALGAAWLETIALFEPVLRHRVDSALRRWNLEHGGSEDWLDHAAPPLSSMVKRMSASSRTAAARAAGRRHPEHPRFQAPVTLEDRIAQLTLGNLASLFPVAPPAKRAKFASGLSGHENLWVYALNPAFPRISADFVSARRTTEPGVPPQVEAAYAVGAALENLRRLRNRVSHQEQTLSVNHAARLAELYGLAGAMAPHTLAKIRQLDRIQRILAMRPRL